MSSVLVPKEQLSAYHRWEMEALESLAPSNSAATEAQAAPTTMPTVEEIERIREQARADGYAAGLEEGRMAGLEQGRAEAQIELSTLRDLIQNLNHEMTCADEAIAQDLLKLALDIAQAILKTTLTVRPGLVLAAVRDAIHYLPTLQPHAQLFLHPLDAVLVAQHIGADLAKAGWRIVEAPEMERGGCRVETSNNQIDGSIKTRWQRIAAVLGSNSEWLIQE